MGDVAMVTRRTKSTGKLRLLHVERERERGMERAETRSVKAILVDRFGSISLSSPVKSASNRSFSFFLTERKLFSARSITNLLIWEVTKDAKFLFSPFQHINRINNILIQHCRRHQTQVQQTQQFHLQ
jgi:hypothetical protein